MGIEKFLRQGVAALVDTVTDAVSDIAKPPPPAPGSPTPPGSRPAPQPPPPGSRPAPRQSTPTLGGDITDIEAFGGWRGLLSVIANDPGERAKLETMLGRPATGRVPIKEFRATRQMAAQQPRLVLALDLAMPGNHADLRPVLGSHFGGTVDDWLTRIWRGAVPNVGINTTDLVRLSAARGGTPADVARAVLSTIPGYGRPHPKRLPGLDELIADQADVVAAQLSPPRRDKLPLWHFIAELPPVTIASLTPSVCEAATCGSSDLRGIGQQLLRHLPSDRAIEELRGIIGDSPATRRVYALHALADVHGPDGREEFARWTAEHLANDRSAAVKEALADLAARAREQETATTVELPQVRMPTISPDDPALRKMPNLDQAARRSSMAAALNGTGPLSRNVVPARILDDALKAGKRLPEDLTTGHIVRLTFDRPPHSWASLYLQLFGRLGRPTPLYFDAVAEADDVDRLAPIAAVFQLMASERTSWTPEELAPWVARNADFIADLLNDTKSNNRSLPSAGVVNTLGVVDPLPPRLEEALVRAAITGPKNQREMLQALVGPERFHLAERYITGRTKTERRAAAEWVKAREITAAAEALRKAADAEKDPIILATQLAALEAIGAGIDEYTGRDRLLQDAQAATKRKSAVPKAMAWLDPSTLPTIRWNDGTEVDQAIVTWLLALAVKSKWATPTPLARQHMAEMDQDSLRAFGRDLFERWLAQDLRTVPPDEARATARQNALRIHQRRQRATPGITVDEIELELYNKLVRKIAGSASSSKGLLGIVALSAGGDVADRAMSYIRTHRGRRVNQSKALLVMLAWIDEPAAVQALMAVAARFRPKGIQNEAISQAEMLAERRGWTMADMADRSVPDGGFDPEGRQRFDYGSRTFTAHLDDDLAITLHNDETAKTVRSLPKARAADDEELVAEARAELKALKKDLKSTAKLQPIRLHQAMCVQRRWDAETFDRFILRHPVMIRLATRLIWTTESPAGERIGFRPLTDGTLIGLDDDEVTLDDAATVSIGHEVTLPDQSEAWREHLSDYEVAPLFPQFGRRPPEIGPNQTTIDDFVGHMIGSRTLRSQAERNNWLLGQPQDGGVVHDITKNLTDVDYSIVVDLTGGIPVAGYYDEDWQCALGRLFAVSNKQGLSVVNAQPLSTIDPILLAESYAELAAIAAAGSGFDPDYRRKVG